MPCRTNPSSMFRAEHGNRCLAPWTKHNRRRQHAVLLRSPQFLTFDEENLAVAVVFCQEFR